MNIKGVKITKSHIKHPVSCTCEFLESQTPEKFCDEPTRVAYPAMGGGWMAMCIKHGAKHAGHVVSATDIIRNGGRWK